MLLFHFGLPTPTQPDKGERVKANYICSGRKLKVLFCRGLLQLFHHSLSFEWHTLPREVFFSGVWWFFIPVAPKPVVGRFLKGMQSFIYFCHCLSGLTFLSKNIYECVFKWHGFNWFYFKMILFSFTFLNTSMSPAKGLKISAQKQRSTKGEN